MAMRFRRSVKIGPGVRLNVGKKSAGLSFGGRGYRYSINTSGRTTRSIGIPGSGASWVESSRRDHSQVARRKVEPAPAAQRQRLERAIPKPGLFAPGWEAAYRKGVVALASGDYTEAAKLFGQASKSDSKNISDDLFLAFSLSHVATTHEAIPLLEKVVGSDIELPDKLQQKYCSGLELLVTTEIVPGIKVEVPFDGSGAALLLSEHYQELGRLDEAAELVEGLGEAGFDATVVALSLAELHSDRGDWESVVAATEGLTNEDDMTATAVVYRAAAFRESGLLDASLAAAQEALRSRARNADVILAARYQRARALEAQGKARMAQKEYEKIVAARSTYVDVTDRLSALSNSPGEQ